MAKFSYYDKPIKYNKYPKKEIDIKELHQIITSDQIKAACKKARELKQQGREEELRKHKATSLPYISVAGTFTERKADKIKCISGYAAIDVDNIQNLEDTRKELEKDPYVHFLFYSPSKGIKLIIKIPKDIENYEKYVVAFYNYLDKEHEIQGKLDKKTKDISRACFVSWDPDAYYNPESKTWTKKYEPQEIESKQQYQEKVSNSSSTAKYSEATLKAMLKHIPCRGWGEHTFYVMMALIDYSKQRDKDYFGLFRWWIQNFKGNIEVEQMQSKWKEYYDKEPTGDKVTIASLVKEAKEHGYMFPNEKAQKKAQEELMERKASGDIIGAVRIEVYQLLLKNDTDAATEKIVNHIKETEHIHTIRDDEKIEVFIYKEGIRIPKGKSYIQEICRDILQTAYTAKLYNLVLKKIIADTFINFDEFFIEEDINLIPLKNGIFNIQTNELLDYSPKYYFFQKLPVTYKPGIDCPNIQKHLKTVLPKEEDIHIIQELFGWCLYRDYNPEKAFMFTGNGRNGKGKTIELLKRFLGVDNCASVPLKRLEGDQGQNFALSELFNKLANLGADISNAKLVETNAFKSLTGHDMINAPRKFLPDVKYTNHAKMVFSANDLPKSEDTSLAFFNRWELVKFPFTFYTKQEFDRLENKTNAKLRDPEIVKKITTDIELSGCFNWAIEGLKRLLEKGDFSSSSTTDEVKNSWIRESDPLRAFIMDNIIDDYDAEIDKRKFKSKLLHYCKTHTVRPPSDRDVKEVLTSEHAVTSKRIRDEADDYYVWQGIRFKEKGENNTIFDNYEQKNLKND